MKNGARTKMSERGRGEAEKEMEKRTLQTTSSFSTVIMACSFENVLKLKQ